MTIRPALPTDFDAIYAIWLDGIVHSFAEFDRPADLQEQFHDNFTTCRPPFGFWVAEVAGNVVGWQSLLPCTSNPMKRHLLAESSTYRALGSHSNGAGEALLRAALAWAGPAGLQFVLAYTLESNTAVGRLYERCGFVPTGQLPPPHSPPLYGPKIFWSFAIEPVVEVEQPIQAASTLTRI
ncbi:GNAT family N-acetyltransferase [Hymenobacter artigasi]|uniref:L-amino acid N-acyltransferase YncA n=1 Tax=Hymenobacter artigasi TaxID=2719616 RepID=A0ABX1HK29_9BACT|nr:GNAT family N-acetyltransferase [Hymenobacter artigasi]NKI90190.1 L-amino acid N-acyltransferase YncA [Hymenobacter artigasi]